MTKAYQDVFYQSHDGLRLYARDYGVAGKTYQTTLLCMHGLTRNSADFHRLALRYGDQYRVISMDQRGRGQSEYDPKPEQYRPDVYCRDMFDLIAHLGLNNIIAIGTSMGGIMAMIMAAFNPKIFKAIVLNDIGPVVEEAGLNHIRSYVGKTGPFENWDNAIANIKITGTKNFPKKSDADWEYMVRAACHVGEDGRIYFSYDPAIMNGLGTGSEDGGNSVPPDLWNVWTAMKSVPTILFRGELSSLLSEKTCDEMQARHDDFSWSNVPDVGHTPLLDEPEVLGVLDGYIAEQSQ